jgi:hypothetical protein
VSIYHPTAVLGSGVAVGVAITWLQGAYGLCPFLPWIVPHIPQMLSVSQCQSVESQLFQDMITVIVSVNMRIYSWWKLGESVGHGGRAEMV